MARKIGPNLFEVERTTGFLWWKKTYTALAYWFTGDTELLGTWCWEEDDSEIDDPDVRIALSEERNRCIREQEESKWTQNK